MTSFTQDLRMLMKGPGFAPVAVLTLALGIGLAGAFSLSRFLQSMLFQIRPTAMWTYVSIMVLLSSVALLACYLPARRATRVDPLVALR
jgi:putative ABC transport system permease protein